VTNGNRAADLGLFLARAGYNALTRPREAIDRIRNFRDARRERAERWQLHPNNGDPYEAVHRFLDVDACEVCRSEFRAVWDGTQRRIVRSTRHDGSTSFALALWIVTRHVMPERAIETGVAQGISTACILEAMALNGRGHLWSIDVPPLGATWHGVVAAAVRQEVRDRWTYVRGGLRRELAPLVCDLGDLDLYVHDSIHTYRNMRDEYALAWPALRPGGVLISDDITVNTAFEEFSRGKAALALAEPLKLGAVGIIRRAAS
jgi:hypothetical protein